MIYQYNALNDVMTIHVDRYRESSAHAIADFIRLELNDRIMIQELRHVQNSCIDIIILTVDDEDTANQVLEVIDKLIS